MSVHRLPRKIDEQSVNGSDVFDPKWMTKNDNDDETNVAAAAATIERKTFRQTDISNRLDWSLC